MPDSDTTLMENRPTTVGNLISAVPESPDGIGFGWVNQRLINLVYVVGGKHSRDSTSERTPGGRPGATTIPTATQDRRRETTLGRVVVAWSFSRGARKRFAEN